MISWTTAREVAFKKCCSNILSFTTSYQSQYLGSNNDISIAEGSGSTEISSFVETYNATGYTSSLYKEYNYYSSYAVTGGAIGVPTTIIVSTSDTFGTFFLSGTTSGSFSGSTLYSFAKQTSTTESFTVYGSITASSTRESSRWTTKTTQLSQESATRLTFASTKHNGTYFYTSGTTLTKTTTAITEDGTTVGNAADTIYLADENEVLWVVDQTPQWSKPLTDNAISTTRTTVSDLRQTADLHIFTTSQEVQTIEFAETTTNKSFKRGSVSVSQFTINRSERLINGSTRTTNLLYSGTATTNTTLELSSQPLITHYGNTETVAATSGTVTELTKRDIIGGNSFIVLGGIQTTTVNTSSVKNTALTHTASTLGANGSYSGTTSCSGNTTVSKQIVCGVSRIAAPPIMIVYAPHGVKVNESKGLFFVGEGFFSIDNSQFIFNTAIDGGFARLTTVSPIVDFPATFSQNSATFETTTQSGTDEVSTTKSISFGASGSTWASRFGYRQGLIGGNLGDDQTALINMPRGLFKNANGETSWFEGHDTTWTGTKGSTYWSPISYLEPAFAPAVFEVFRNSSDLPP